MNRLCRAALVIGLLSLPSAWAQPPEAAKSRKSAAPPPKLAVRLAAANESIAPGGTTELAIELEVPRPWHFYYPLILDTGFPTTIQLDLPDGLKTGELRFPTPELGKTLGQEYLGFEGKAVVLTTLTAAADAKPGTTLKLAATAKALACIEECIPIEGTAELKLPVTAQAGAAANAKLFETAAAALPPPLATAPRLKGSRITVVPASVPVGGRAELRAELRIEKGFSIIDRDPGLDGLISARLFVDAADGIKFDEQAWPKPKTVELKGLGKFNKLAGDATIRVPFEIEDKLFKPGPVRLRVLLRYQACSDAGECYPPAMASGWAEFEVTPGAPDGGAVAGTGGNVAAGAAVADGSGSRSVPASLWWLFLGAFLGGAILNIMPCVLPVISLKVLGFAQQAGEDRSRVLTLGLVYAAGILASFAVLAAVMLKFGLAWGGLMQQPQYIMVLAAIVFAFALSLLGVFELRLPGAVESAAGAAATREGAAGAFLNGLMATALATPCTAPLLGPAIGVLVKLPPAVAAAGIMTVGLGLATPYVILAAFPQWLRLLPRPGPWMVTFKQVMGFVLLATVVWLLWILQYLVDSSQLIATLAFFVAVGLACWLVGRLTLASGLRAELATWSFALAVVLGGWFGAFWLLADTEPGSLGGARATTVATDEWKPWRAGLPEELAAAGKTVYVDFTAKWCATCLANKKLVLNRDPVRARLDELGVVRVIADFTRNDPDIKAELERFSRAGVPLNLIYPAGRPADVIVLPEVLTNQIVLDALASAGPSTPGRDLARFKP